MLLRSLVSRKGLSNRINSVWVDARPSCMSSPWWRLGCRTSDWSDRLITRGFETLSCSWMKVSYWSWHLEVEHLTTSSNLDAKTVTCVASCHEMCESYSLNCNFWSPSEATTWHSALIRSLANLLRRVQSSEFGRLPCPSWWPWLFRHMSATSGQVAFLGVPISTWSPAKPDRW